MEFRGEFLAGTDRAAMWEFLMDPQKIAWCGPGVREVTVTDATHYRIGARVGIGVIAAMFRIDAEVTEVVERESAKVSVTAQAPGTSVQGLASMALSDDPAGTRMEWDVTVQISGKLAAVGERLIRGTAERMIQQTFACIRTKLEEQAAAASA